MKIQLIRSATLVLELAGRRLLIDPDFAPRHARPSFTGRSANPMVALPFPAGKILRNVELVLVSHLHRDHFSEVEPIPKHLPVLCQPGDECEIAAHGFTEVIPLERSFTWRGIRFTRTAGHHGLGEVERVIGQTIGFVLEAPGEPTLYWAGDTVLCSEVRKVLTRYNPDIVVVHACGATWPVADGRELIVMDAKQSLEVCRLAPQATVIATHLDAFDHATVSRTQLRAAAERAGFGEAQLQIPQDGEVLELSHDRTRPKLAEGDTSM